jgi:hypothetical protein
MIEKEIAICPNCDELRGMEIALIQASYSEKHLVCPECEDEFDKV